MKVVFVSNFYNHHQSALSAALHQLTGGEYRFIATEEMPEEQRNLGYGREAVPDYVLYTYGSREAHDRCQAIINEADVVITGSAPETLFRDRIKAGKPVFRYSERPLKKGLQPVKYFPRLLRWHIRNPRNKPIFMLCASAYTAGDYAKFGLFHNRCYRWGYFPKVNRYAPDALRVKKQNQTPKILWCGRFLDWKHPDDAVQVAKLLKQAGYVFELNFIGAGDMEATLEQMIVEQDLQDCVRLLGAMPPEQVREHMERANVYLFTSDRNEGWGAVLNESMNSGCAVVASHAIGSVPFLMKDGENGLIYRSGDVDMLYEKTKYLLDHPEEQLRLGQAAYQTMVETWNAEVAAERFLTLVDCIQNGTETPYTDGPCSRADKIRDDWTK